MFVAVDRKAVKAQNRDCMRTSMALLACVALSIGACAHDGLPSEGGSSDMAVPPDLTVGALCGDGVLMAFFRCQPGEFCIGWTARQTSLYTCERHPECEATPTCDCLVDHVRYCYACSPINGQFWCREF